MSKKVLVVNYYKTTDPETGGVKEITKAIKNAGGEFKVVHHTEAEKLLAEGKDLLKGYGSAHASGSDISWNDKAENGVTYKHPGSNKLIKYLLDQKKPVKFDCGSGQAAYHEIGELQKKNEKETRYRVVDTGEFNKEKIKGYVYNHKYGMDASNLKGGDLEKKITNVKTFEHNKKNYVSSFNYGNKEITQYHPGRSTKGETEIKSFHKL